VPESEHMQSDPSVGSSEKKSFFKKEEKHRAVKGIIEARECSHGEDFNRGKEVKGGPISIQRDRDKPKSFAKIKGRRCNRRPSGLFKTQRRGIGGGGE